MKKAPLEFYESMTGINQEATCLKGESGTKLDFINRKIASMESLESMIDFLFVNIQEIIPCERLAVSFFEEDGKRLIIHHVKTSYETTFLDKGYSAPVNKSSLEKVFSSGTPRIINNLNEYLKDHPTSDTTAMLLKEGINSSITCPLSVEDRSVGLLFISSKGTETYSKDHLICWMQLIERLGQAVEKTYRIEKLSDAINSYMEMLGFVSHELKSPLDSIISLGNTLAGGYFGTMDEKHRDYVLRMISKAKYLREMTGEYLTLSRFESDRMDLNLAKTDFNNEIIEEAVEIILPQIFDKNVKINRNFPDESVVVECDPTLMKIVVNNLMSNAVKYSDEDGVIDIEIIRKKDNLCFKIRNTGPGFPEEAKSKLFRKFSRIETDELMKRKGTGVGLYTSWKIIELHGGEIRADSKPGEWAEFSFTIPLSQENPQAQKNR